MFATHWRYNFGWGKDKVDGALDPLSCFFFCSGKEKLKCYRLGMPTKQKNSGLFFLFLTFLVTAQEPYKGADKVYIWLTLMVR